MNETIERYRAHTKENTGSSCSTEIQQDDEHQLLEQQLLWLQEKDKTLVEENTSLHEKCKLQNEPQIIASKEDVPNGIAGSENEVETELCIGCPGRGRRCSSLQG
ncbi:hypothetical protein Cni_G16212 [Canna indica]|uniref:Uncharacterized protein n=1 Tax=Canna indica TaxID=4628 RepID=A0AAQ3QFG2_9LILI|nr:hypothetical protein Cni_G16212 [Canna indica]